VVFEGERKLIKIGPMPGKSELFDLEKDLVEKEDVTVRNPEVVKDFEGRLLAYVGAGQRSSNPCEARRRLPLSVGAQSPEHITCTWPWD
jgi:hypothetical protein